MMKSANPRKKILYVVNHFKHHGGVEKMLSHKIDAWIESYGYDVTVITIDQGIAPVVYLPKNSFKLIDLGLEGVNRHRFKDLRKFVKQLKKNIKNEFPDLIITTLTGIPSLILPFICPKVKKVLEIHSSGALSVTPNWKYKWFFLNRYDKVALLNEDEKQYYQLDNLIVLPNFIPITEDRNLNYSNRQNRVVAAGRIHPDKQYHHLIRIWEHVFVKYPDWYVEIYGDGDPTLLTAYNEYIETHKIERIVFKPATERLDEILIGSSILCLTSETESFSMILAEAKNAMLPVISYDCPHGPRHVIKDDGILIEHNNIELFAEELSRLIEDEELRTQLSRRAYNNRRLCSSEEIIKKWNELVKN